MLRGFSVLSPFLPERRKLGYNDNKIRRLFTFDHTKTGQGQSEGLMPLQIIRNDITKVYADAIVNTANPEPMYGSGTDAAVYKAAGEGFLLKERREIGELCPGEVNVTDAYGLHARYIIHTVGPTWVDGKHGEFGILSSCYRKSLHLALKLGCESVAFPLIATGVYRFPKDKALQTALRVIREFLEGHDMMVTLVVFSREAYQLSSELSHNVRQYIDDHYYAGAMKREYGWDPLSEEDRRNYRREADVHGYAGFPTVEEDYYDSVPDDLPEESHRPLMQQAPSPLPSAAPKAGKKNTGGVFHLPKKKDWESVFGKSEKKPAKKTLDDYLAKPGETFQQMLMRKIEEKDMTGPEVYKKANLDKKLFSKIKTNPVYTPKKQTAVALAIALRLNLDETVDLLGRAGLALSPSNTFDLIITFCIENNQYDVFEINSLLFDYDQPLLGC